MPGSSGEEIPIGYPVANTSVFLVEPAREDAARPGIGELVLAGDGLADGYISKRSGRRTVSGSDYIGGSAEMLYFTGDLASLTADGSLVFHGRIDFQLKISGVRIEPDELRY